MQILPQALGAALMLFVMLDIFLTVLYSRIGSGIVGHFGTGILSMHAARAVWIGMRAFSARLRRSRSAFLSFSGPVSLLFLIALWTIGLACGAALIIHPELGASVSISRGETPTDFISALYAAGASLSITGSMRTTARTSTSACAADGTSASYGSPNTAHTI
jgi:hypothetical protein